MALSVKFALLTCLLFTGGMCWLVNQVGRPAGSPNLVHASAGERALLAATAPPRSHPPISVAAERDVARSTRLQHESPVVRSQDAATVAGTIVESEAVPALAGDVRIPPPPEHSPLLEMRSAAENSEIELAQNGGLSVETGAEAQEGERDAARFAGIPVRLVGNPVPSVTIYAVQKGDSLSQVCREFYGDMHGEGKGLVLAENPRVAGRKNMFLQLGEVLQIPPLDGANGMAEDVGGMEASDSMVMQVLPAPPEDAPDAVIEEADEPVIPKLARTNTKKAGSNAKKSPTAPPSKQLKARPSSPKPPPPGTKFASAARSTGKSRGSSAIETNKKPAGKGTSKNSAKPAPTRKNTAALSPKPSPSKRPAQPSKKNVRRASLQEVLEADPPATLAMIMR